MSSPHPLPGTGSAAAIAGPSLKPVIALLPISALVLALAADIAYFVTEQPFWAEGAEWLLLAVLVAGALSSALGLIDLVSLPRARNMRVALLHGAGNGIVLALTLANYLMRPSEAAGEPMLDGFILTALAVALAGATGWLGGEPNFRHGTGVSRGVGAEAGSGPVPR